MSEITRTATRSKKILKRARVLGDGLRSVDGAAGETSERGAPSRGVTGREELAAEPEAKGVTPPTTGGAPPSPPTAPSLVKSSGVETVWSAD